MTQREGRAAREEVKLSLPRLGVVFMSFSPCYHFDSREKQVHVFGVFAYIMPNYIKPHEVSAPIVWSRIVRITNESLKYNLHVLRLSNPLCLSANCQACGRRVVLSGDWRPSGAR